MKKHFLRFTASLFCFILFSSCAAQQIAPPKEENKREADLIELVKLDNTIKLDIRYARSDNFVGKPVYPEARAFLQRPAAEAVVRVHQKLKEKGLGLVIFDGYRPWSITKLFWETVREDQKKFVADPAKGSKHNRGCAVDLSIYDLQTGKLIEMPSDYDEFTDRASPAYTGGTDAQRKNRDLLRTLMEAEGFNVNADEWWHFDYREWRDYPIYDVAFSSIRNTDELRDFRVRRVEFVGNEKTRDRVLRRVIHLNEGDLFIPENLAKSIIGINSLGIFETISDLDVSWRPIKANKDVDLIFFLSEKGKSRQIARAEMVEKKDWKKYFDAAKVTGGIVIYDLRQNKFTVYDRGRMDKGFVPASTSKIIHSLIILESGAVKDENEVIKWDGVKRFSPDWNKDHNLRTAFQTSAAWFYLEASKRITRETMQKYYDSSNYGNRSTNGFGDFYWVKGDLRITPREQVEFLVRLYENDLPFAQRSIDLVKDIMIAEKTDNYILRGKTGWSGDAYTPQVGWWIGYVTRGQNAYFFAIELDMKGFEDAEKRKTITKEILKSQKIIE